MRFAARKPERRKDITKPIRRKNILHCEVGVGELGALLPPTVYSAAQDDQRPLIQGDVIGALAAPAFCLDRDKDASPNNKGRPSQRLEAHSVTTALTRFRG